jgi:hypothetical protein
MNYLPRLVSNLDPPDLYLLCFSDYRHESLFPKKEILTEVFKMSLKEISKGWTWWFTSEIPANFQAEIWRITVLGQTRQKVSGSPSQPTSRPVSLIPAIHEA